MLLFVVNYVFTGPASKLHNTGIMEISGECSAMKLK